MSSGSSLLSAGGSVTSGMPRSREVLLGQVEEAFNSLCRQVGEVPAFTRCAVYHTGAAAAACKHAADTNTRLHTPLS